MAPCLCAPTSHEGSFRCRLHRAVIRSVRGASNRDSWSTVSQASAAVPCLCAPTSHPGSFRCRLHRTKEPSWGGRPLLPSAHAKALRSSELPPAKPSDTISVKKTAFARTNRSTLSESKLRSELNKAMPEIVAAVDKLRITPVEILTKKGKLVVAPVPGTATVRAASNSIVSQENSLLSDAVAAKATKEILMRSQNKGVKKPPTCKERRSRAKSDVLATILT